MDGSSKLVPGCKLNLGCGRDLREGWVNIDLHGYSNPDIVCDITNLTPIPDGMASYVLAQDVLEHLPRIQTRQVLKEWNRVMAMGGTIEIRTTDVIGLVKLMEHPNFDSLRWHQQLIHNLFGTQAVTGDFHFTGFTHRTMKAYLDDAGFHITKFGHKDGWLFDLLATKVRDERPLTEINPPSDILGWVI